MSFYCEKCENIVLYSENTFYCSICNHKTVFVKPKTKCIQFNTKTDNGIIKRNESLGNFCEILCEKCENNTAQFIEMQTRSADEPATIFYKCTKCGFSWKQN